MKQCAARGWTLNEFNKHSIQYKYWCNKGLFSALLSLELITNEICLIQSSITRINEYEIPSTSTAFNSAYMINQEWNACVIGEVCEKETREKENEYKQACDKAYCNMRKAYCTPWKIKKVKDADKPIRW